ncbi:MAG: dsDNA nuclease domain-containing protein [Gammaproteobacteria bacterium]|nr:dsDNA nuclease domain-containing protein [Gammaproteobacteria bacterium]MDE0286368.1 dsDNA nuclease domain-containing protein [Gammaproteobacteria bacterium]MDE0514687.1 dsDNA nuclease domain-containing protein [Gammaproteobacteria bacterium]
MPPEKTPRGDPSREAIASLRGYVYQIYQSALAWTELKDDELLYLEVAEDFAVVAEGALKAVQVKNTAGRVTINSEDIIATIESFVELQEKNPSLKVTLRYLTTSAITKEKNRDHRIGDAPTLDAWRNLAKAGELSGLRQVLDKSKLSKKSKDFVKSLDDKGLRERFLKRIHFDCGAPDPDLITRRINSRISKLLTNRGGDNSQTQNCVANILLTVLN